MAEETVNYEKWFNGKLELESAISYSKCKADEPKIVSIDSFSDYERALIRKNQEEYFNTQIDELLNRWMDNFEVQFEASKAKRILVQRNLSKLYSALIGNVQDLMEVDVVQLVDGELVNRLLYVNALKYFNECYVKGIPFDFTTIPNPISRQNLGNKILPEVYAESLVGMYKFLKVNFFPNDRQRVIEDKKYDLKEELDKDDESEFAVPPIFSGIEAFRAFLLCINTLPIEEHRTSSLSFIYYLLHSHKYDYAIKYEVSKSEFSDFCNGFEKIKHLMIPVLEADQIRNVRTKAVLKKFDELKKKADYFK
jgi:hypothetical protein